MGSPCIPSGNPLILVGLHFRHLPVLLLSKCLYGASDDFVRVHVAACGYGLHDLGYPLAGYFIAVFLKSLPYL